MKMTDEKRIMRVKDICMRLRPILGNRIDKIWQAYTLEDDEGKSLIEQSLEIMLAQNIKQDLYDKNVLLVPPSRQNATGEYVLGNICYNNKTLYPFGLKEQELIQHVAIFGRSGAGKTNLGFLLVSQLAKNNKPFLVFDWKRNYRDLLVLPLFQDTIIFTVGRDIAPLKFNPLIPPKGTNPKVWLKKIIELIAHAYFLGEGVIYLLQKAVNSAYKRFGVYSGNVDYPTFHDILKWLKNYKTSGREANWLASTLRAISTLCFGEMGRIVNTRQNIGLEKLLEKKVILELDALTQSDKVFLIETLLLWIHHFRMAENIRERFKHATIIEEAHHILSRTKGSLTGGETVMDITFREIREFGEALIILDQHPSQISLPALGNTYCTVCMNLKHRKDVNVAAACMLLDEEKDYLGSLAPGEAIVKLQSRISGSFLIRIDEFPIRKGIVNDDMIREKMTGYFRIFQQNNNLRKEITHIPEKGKEGEITKYKIFGIEQDLLEDILRFPASCITERYKRLGLSTRKGNATKNALIKKGFILPRQISTSKGRVMLFELTEKAKCFVSRKGHKICYDRNGLEHRFWKYRIAEYFRKKGYIVEIEKTVNGRVDVVVKNKNQKIAVEIETGKSNAIGNIIRDIEKGFDMVICVATSREIEERIKKELEKRHLDRDERIRVTCTQNFEIE